MYINQACTTYSENLSFEVQEALVKLTTTAKLSVELALLPKKNGIKIADYNMEMRGFYCPCPRKDKVSPGCNHIFINLFLFQRGGVQMLFLLLISLIVFAAVVVDLVALGADIIVGGGVLLLLLLLVCCW